MTKVTVAWVLKQAPLKSHRKAFPKGATIQCPLRFGVAHRSDSRTGFSTSWSLKNTWEGKESSTCLAKTLQHHQLLMGSNPSDRFRPALNWQKSFFPHCERNKLAISHFNWTTKLRLLSCNIIVQLTMLEFWNVSVACWNHFCFNQTCYMGGGKVMLLVS